MKAKSLLFMLLALLTMALAVPLAIGVSLTIDTVTNAISATFAKDAILFTACLVLIAVATLATVIHSKQHQFSRQWDKLKRTLGQLRENNIFATY